MREVEDVIFFYIVLIAKENDCVLGPIYTLIQCPVEVSIQKLENGTQKMVPLPQGHLALMGHPKSLHKNPSTLANPHWLQIMRSHGASAEGNGCLSLWKQQQMFEVQHFGEVTFPVLPIQKTQ